jgi:hypothetical protein
MEDGLGRRRLWNWWEGWVGDGMGKGKGEGSVELKWEEDGESGGNSMVCVRGVE